MAGLAAMMSDARDSVLRARDVRAALGVRDRA
jgi:hypothetical protein